MPMTEPTSNRAREAAEQLAAQGEHVHLFAEGQAECINRFCPIEIS